VNRSGKQSNMNAFLQPVSIFIEQGCELLLFELVNRSGKQVLATLQLDPNDLVTGSEVMGFDERVYTMTPCHRGILQVRITLTVRSEEFEDSSPFMEMIHNIHEEDLGVGLMVQNELQAVYNKEHGYASSHLVNEEEARHLDQFALAIAACRGPVLLYGIWGRVENAFVAVVREPGQISFGIWKDESSYQSGKRPRERINVLKVVSVQPETSSEDCFLLNVMVARGVKKRYRFERVDRSRDVWVDLLTLVVDAVRRKRDEVLAKRRQERASTSRSNSHEHTPRAVEAMRQQIQNVEQTPAEHSGSPREQRRQRLQESRRFGNVSGTELST